jgi:hypothetical protein
MRDSDDDSAQEEEKEEEDNDSKEVIRRQEETREERWLRRQRSMEKGDDSGRNSDGDEGLAPTELISDEDQAGFAGVMSLNHEIKQENCTEKAPTQNNKRASPINDGDGAGGSSPKTNLKKVYPKGIASLDTKKEWTIAGIRAALRYAGYPSAIIRNLLAKKLVLNPDTNLTSFSFRINLPNGKLARSFADIDRNPYPGGKITPKSQRKCHVHENCERLFGHLGSCILVENEAQDDKRYSPSNPSNPTNKKLRAENASPLPSSRPKLLLSSSSDDEDDGEEKAEEELEAEAPRAESPIYLLTTTEEDNTTSSSGGFDSEDESIAN